MEAEIVKVENTALTATISNDLLASFINFIDVAEKSVETYERALAQMFYFFQDNGISQPTREDIVAYREHLKASGHKPTTIQNYITACKLFFEWTAQEGIYPDIAEHLKGAKLSREHKKDYFTSKQVKRILDGVKSDTLKGKRDYAIIALMVTGGLRTIEVQRADIEDLRTLGNDTVLYIQGKGRAEKADYVKISAPVEAAIREYLKARGKTAPTEPLFTSASNHNNGGRMDTRSISRIAKEAFKKAGYDSSRLTAHSLRHTAVTLSLLAGKDITEVQQFARHTNISTTMIYNHALDKAKNSCSAAITEAIF